MYKRYETFFNSSECRRRFIYLLIYLFTGDIFDHIHVTSLPRTCKNSHEQKERGNNDVLQIRHKIAQISYRKWHTADSVPLLSCCVCDVEQLTTQLRQTFWIWKETDFCDCEMQITENYVAWFRLGFLFLSSKQTALLLS